MTQDEPTPVREKDWPSARQIRFFIVLAATFLGLYLCYLLTLPFLTPLTWAIVLSVIFSPMHGRIAKHIGQPTIAALITVTAVTILVVVPVVFVAKQLVRETAIGAVYLENELRTGEWRAALSGYPSVARAATWVEGQLELAGTAGQIASALTTLSTSALGNSINQLINVILTFYLFFFFLRDKRQILRSLYDLSALKATETKYVIDRFAETIHATVFGTLVVAAVQGTLGGLMFWWLGLPLPLLWATVMGMLAIVPVLGAFVIWVPAAIYLTLEGEWGKALILTGWGGGVVAGIDNLLYPALVGNRLKLHTVPALIGAFGGIILFGASGLILGPAIISVTMALVEILKKRFNKRTEL